MENVWAGFDNLIRAFFISYFDNKRKGILLLSHTLFIHLFCLCVRLWCIVFFTKAKRCKNILAIKFWLLESNTCSYLFNV